MRPRIGGVRRYRAGVDVPDLKMKAGDELVSIRRGREWDWLLNPKEAPPTEAPEFTGIPIGGLEVGAARNAKRRGELVRVESVPR